MLHPQLKKYINIAMFVWLPFLASTKKIIDHLQSEHYQNLTLHTLKIDSPQTEFITDPQVFTTQSKDFFSQLDTQPFQENKIKTALNNYRKNYLPRPDYHINPEDLSQLTTKRIESNPVPRVLMINWIDDYANKNRIRNHIEDACLTHTTGELLRMKIRWNSMYAILWQTGKKVRNFTQQLEQIWWKSLSWSRDNLSLFEELHHTKNAPDHYIKLIQNAQHSKAGDIFVFRNAASWNIPIAKREGGKNATHIAFSHWVVQQVFSLSQLGLSSNTIPNLKDYNGKAEMIYRLMTYQGTTRDGKHLSRRYHWDMIGEKTVQIERIKNLITEFPELLEVSQDDTSQDIIFNGTFITHDYHGNLEVQFLCELLAANGHNSNAKHPNPISKNSCVSWGQFLMTDGFRTWDEALKFNKYSWLSPLYEEIYKLRWKLIQNDKVLYTHIVKFDEVDHNNNNKIDKHDKSTGEILNDMMEEYFRITYDNGIGMTSNDFTNYKKSNQREEDKLYLSSQIKPYIKIYLEMLGIIDNLPIHTSIPIPYLSEKNKIRIMEQYQSYKTLMYDQFDKASQQRYQDYIIKQLKSTTLQGLQQQPIIVYPFTTGEGWDEIAITKSIVGYIDTLIEHNPQRFKNKSTQFWDLNRKELNEIYKIIQDDILLPWKMERGKKAFINLPKVLLDIVPYLEFRNKLLTSTLNSIDEEVIGISDETAEILKIHPAIRDIQKQRIIRESWVRLSWINIADKRTLGKMIGEKIGMDHTGSPVNKIYSLQSEWILQLRIDDNYLNSNDEIWLIIQTARHIKANEKALSLSRSNQKRLQRIISQAYLTKRTNKPESITEFTEQKKKLKNMLSDLIELKPNARSDKSIGSLFILKLDSYTTESFLMRYGKILQNSLWTKTINAEEISFLQQFTVKACQLGQNDADKAFKIYISSFLISRWAIYEKISMDSKKLFYNELKKLHSYRKEESANIFKKSLWIEQSSSQWYKDFVNWVDQKLWSKSNGYIQEILEYLHSTQDLSIINIPHYKVRRSYNNITQWRTSLQRIRKRLNIHKPTHISARRTRWIQ